ncbi:MAG TPA: cell division protein FtsA, partial [Alphaproteobacteria bacterium]|nr:cell division protein FtsA [Alphaproteobacteria bacterium]
MSALWPFGQDRQSPGPARPAVCAALDLGSSKIACFISKTEETATGMRPRVVGVGHLPARGMRAGSIVDLDVARDTIREAVQRAEKMAGLAVSMATVTLTAGNIRSARIRAESVLSSREVSDRDLKRLLDAAIAEADAPDRVILHAFPLGWSVDDSRGIRDPRGMFGHKLGVSVHVITAAAGPLRNLLNCIQACHLDLKGVVVTPYAAGLAALTDDEIELGATLIDMGAGTTSAAVFDNGALVHVDTVPIGGSHVTNDVARGLSTPLVAAERIKILYGSALDSPDDDREMIEVPPLEGASDRMGTAPRSLLNAIIRPRLDETFEMLRDRLKAAGVNTAKDQQLVLTGGAAQLPGASEVATRVFGRQARVSRPHGVAGLGDAVSGPAFAAASGI